MTDEERRIMRERVNNGEISLKELLTMNVQDTDFKVLEAITRNMKEEK